VVVVEVTYLYQVAQWWALQPDLQFVVNPGAGIPSTYSNKLLKNAVMAGVRATVTF
jgi:porin